MDGVQDVQRQVVELLHAIFKRQPVAKRLQAALEQLDPAQTWEVFHLIELEPGRALAELKATQDALKKKESLMAAIGKVMLADLRRRPSVTLSEDEQQQLAALVGMEPSELRLARPASLHPPPPPPPPQQQQQQRAGGAVAGPALSHALHRMTDAVTDVDQTATVDAARLGSQLVPPLRQLPSADSNDSALSARVKNKPHARRKPPPCFNGESRLPLAPVDELRRPHQDYATAHVRGNSAAPPASPAAVAAVEDHPLWAQARDAVAGRGVRDSLDSQASFVSDRSGVCPSPQVTPARNKARAPMHRAGAQPSPTPSKQAAKRLDNRANKDTTNKLQRNATVSSSLDLETLTLAFKQGIRPEASGSECGNSVTSELSTQSELGGRPGKKRAELPGQRRWK